MDETTVANLGQNELEQQPVEIKFGDVVEFLYEGHLPTTPYIIIDPGTETYTYASEILSDKEGEEILAGGGTISVPLRVVGSWPFEKIVEATHRLYLGKDGQEVPGMKQKVKELLTVNAEKPPVMYIGREQQG